MSDLIEEYRAKEHIDVNNLSEELAHQAEIFDAVADQYAKAIATRDDTDAEVKRIYAALAKEIRNSFDKLSDAKLDTEVLVRVEYVDTLKKAIDAKYQANRWFAVKEAFNQRASMLSKLVDLLKISYLGVTQIPQSTHETATFLEAKIAAQKARQERKEHLTE